MFFKSRVQNFSELVPMSDFIHNVQNKTKKYHFVAKRNKLNEFEAFDSSVEAY